LKFLILIIWCIFNNILEHENYEPIIGAFTKSINKPVALLKASRDIARNTLSSLFGKASSLWGSSKKNKGIKENSLSNIKHHNKFKIYAI